MSKRTLVLFLAFLLIATPVAATTPWTSKPPLGSQINWGHPLSNGLVGAWLMNEGGGLVVKNIAGNNNGIISGLSWKSTSKGSALNHPQELTGNSVNLGTSFNSTLNGNFSISLLFRFTYGGTNREVFFGANGVDSARQIARNWQTANRITFGEENVAYIYTTTFDLDTSGDSIWYHIVWTNKNGVQYFYLNGVQVGTASRAFTGSFGGSYYIGSPSNSLCGSVANTLIYNRALSPSEIQQLYVEPYCFIENRSWTLWGAVTEAVGGAVQNIRNAFGQGVGSGIGGGMR